MKVDSSNHDKTELTIETVVKVAEQLYSHLSGLSYYKHKLRPYICPFHMLISYIPINAKVLDVGCGSGLFAGLIASFKSVKSITGFDANASAIKTAQSMLENNEDLNSIVFEYRDARSGLPEGLFDVVSMIDVLHHVPVTAQMDVINAACEHVAPEGVFLYKDMVKKPLWRAWANRLHDIILAREWIHYADINNVKKWAVECGLTEVEKGSCNMLWYGHEWIVMKKTMNNLK